MNVNREASLVLGLLSACAVGVFCLLSAAGCGSPPVPRYKTPPEHAKMPGIHIENMEVSKLKDDEAIYADASLLLVDKFTTVWIKNLPTLREPPTMNNGKGPVTLPYLKIFKKDGLFYVVIYGKESFKIEEKLEWGDKRGHCCRIPKACEKNSYDNVDLIPVAGLVIRPKPEAKEEDFETLFQGKTPPFVEVAKE